ncbi:MAG: ATP-binding protein [Anaerolineae bacterium]|nr:ATP-binding protein [Anaerolineae bacterium]
MIYLRRLLDVPSKDPDDARHRKLLNILLTGIGIITLIALLFITVANITQAIEPEDIASVYWGSLAIFVGVIVVFAINRYWSGDLASTLFLLLLTIVLAFGDEPLQVVEGRTLIMFAAPILMASVLLRPAASFVFATLSSLIVIWISRVTLNIFPNIPGILTFFVLALVSWLSSRSLENVLRDLRTVNAELDQRVEMRTRELTEANQQLAEANDRLKELDRLKSKFVSMVSHELRTPLNAIQGFAEMLVAGVYGRLSAQQEGAMDRITFNADRLLRIVSDLLDQARIEAGELAIHVKAFSISELIDDLSATMGILVESKGLKLITEIDYRIPEIMHGDPHRLHQILVNLTNNALKFTEKGAITVKVYPPDADHWALEISDTGVGIPQEAQSFIFQPFQQVDSSPTREHQGVGLGLAIVKQLAELMNGEIIVESEVEKGSTFTIVLPLLTPHHEGEN